MRENDFVKGWFVFEVRTNYGKIVKKSLENMMMHSNLSDKIYHIALPSRSKSISYIFVNMIADPALFSMIHKMQYVKKLLGSMFDPQPLSVDDIQCML